MANYQTMTSEKNKDTALMLCILGGLFGLHQYYVGNIFKGIIYTCTAGLFTIGWISDIIKISLGSFRDNVGLPLRATKYNYKSMKVEKKENNNIFPNYNKISNNIYINEHEQKIIINNNIFNFSNILEAKLIENEFQNILGSNLKVGNSNLLVGSNKQLVNKLDIEIKTNDMNNPFFSISFLNLGIHTGFYRTSKKYEEAYQQAQHCLSILEIIIKNNAYNTYN